MRPHSRNYVSLEIILCNYFFHLISVAVVIFLFLLLFNKGSSLRYGSYVDAIVAKSEVQRICMFLL